MIVSRRGRPREEVQRTEMDVAEDGDERCGGRRVAIGSSEYGARAAPLASRPPLRPDRAGSSRPPLRVLPPTHRRSGGRGGPGTGVAPSGMRAVTTPSAIPLGRKAGSSPSQRMSGATIARGAAAARPPSPAGRPRPNADEFSLFQTLTIEDPFPYSDSSISTSCGFSATTTSSRLRVDQPVVPAPDRPDRRARSFIVNEAAAIGIPFRGPYYLAVHRGENSSERGSGNTPSPTAWSQHSRESDE